MHGAWAESASGTAASDMAIRAASQRLYFLDLLRIVAFVTVLIGHKFQPALRALAQDPDQPVWLCLPIVMKGASVIDLLSIRFPVARSLCSTVITRYVAHVSMNWQPKLRA